MTTKTRGSLKTLKLGDINIRKHNIRALSTTYTYELLSKGKTKYSCFERKIGEFTKEKRKIMVLKDRASVLINKQNETS